MNNLQLLNEAHRRMFALARQGKLEKPDRCEGCGQGDVYLKWWFEDYHALLDSVVWLCEPCRHGTYRERIRDMATTQGTFAQWLTKQSGRPETDPIGWLARLWDSFEGNRPKLSAPTSIARFLQASGNPSPDWQSGMAEAMVAATEAYTQARNAAAVGEQPAEPQPVRYGDATEPGDVPPDDHELAEAARRAGNELAYPPDEDALAQQAADLASQYPVSAAAGIAEHLPPQLHEGLAAGVSEADATYLANQLDQIGAQLGLVMQMLAVSSPAAAEVLLNHLSADAATVAAADDVDAPSAAQLAAQELAARNGWMPPATGHVGDRTPPPAMADGWEAWYAQAEAGSDDDG